jgi:hypothetical protein
MQCGELIIARGARGVSFIEALRLDGIFGVALKRLHPDLWPQVTEAIKRLMLALGLAREMDDGGLKPTRLLQSVYMQIQNNHCLRFDGHPPKRIIPRFPWPFGQTEIVKPQVRSKSTNMTL